MHAHIHRHTHTHTHTHTHKHKSPSSKVLMITWEPMPKLCSCIIPWLLLLYSIYVFNFYQDNFWMLQFTDRFSSLNHQAYWKKKNMIEILPYHLKFPQEISLITIILDWVWQKLLIILFPESKLNIYLCNLRWHDNRFQTLRRCYRGIFNFQTLKIWEIDFLGTRYTHTNFQTRSIYRTAELEIPIPIFYCTTVTNYILNCRRKKFQ